MWLKARHSLHHRAANPMFRSAKLKRANRHGAQAELRLQNQNQCLPDLLIA
jgi:hypothetical protein